MILVPNYWSKSMKFLSKHYKWNESRLKMLLIMAKINQQNYITMKLTEVKMKIIVKHLGTEIEVSDTQHEDGRSLLYHNESYSLRLLEKIIEQIRLLEKGGQDEK